MNNTQFRKLVLDTPARQPGSGESKSTLGATPRRDGATPSALGSRMRSSIPMTPRSVGGVDFARQLAERNASSSEPPTKKFRSAAAPKGAKLPEGYVDRARMRAEEDVDDDKEERVLALEKLMKEKQIDFPTFVKLRNEILSEEGGKAMGKGLNFKLEEDIMSVGQGSEEITEDVDDEFEELEGREVKAVEKEQATKKGQMAPPSLIPGKKRNRDQILAEMKAARQAAKEAAGPSLGSKFKKLGERSATSRIETDSKGREVLITTDENGNEKRRVRKIQIDPELEKRNELLVPDKDAKPLGMEVPEIPKPAEEEDDDMNIFDDAGDDYDPLAGLGDDNEDSDEEGEVPPSKLAEEEEPELRSMAPPPRPSQPSAPRNYFGDSKIEEATESRSKASQDPVLLAAIKKASTLNPIVKEAENAEEAAKEARRKKMLQQDDRDAQDMDMGFGSSRFEDEADFDDKKVKLSEWGSRGDDDDNEDGGKGDGKSKRKRGPKKRKGDGNNAADVMKVLERRKAAEK
ncbi:hypothetical protein D0Z07_2333 [Hyphodiscus hymeniophilus]|uniref:RED-like N-terminal domain-containing protein n=1 Tax=Hyphodiscus hymeniophilus TaxID=353542 RepID=A0A9P6VNI6_9HELO|nr:hypothetical protein D0Z07_2333 [Hyphodiscus hymeniophilus]